VVSCNVRRHIPITDCVFVVCVLRFHEVSEWCNKPKIKVAITVDADRVSSLIKERLIAP
jgi:hypothetical protein